jgi:hypothetical protein
MRRALVIGATWLGLGLASSALAQTRVVVHELDGPFAGKVREAVVAELRDHSIEVVEPGEADSAASAASADLATDAGRVKVARELQVAAFVRGETERAGSSRARVKLALYSGQDGSQLVDTSFAAPKPKLSKLAATRMWKAFGPALQVARAPSTEPEPVAKAELAPQPIAEAREPAMHEPDEDPAVDSEDDDAQGDTSPLDLSFGARVGTRRFTYNDAFPGLRGYKLGLSPNLALQLRWYPAAHVTGGFAANVGLELRGEMLLGVSSKNSAGDEFDTSSSELGLGLRLRFPIARGSEWAAVLGYGRRTFTLGKSGGAGAGVPNVGYGFLRVGADLRLALVAPVALLARAAFLPGLAQGPIAADAWFPHASGHGVEGELGAGVRIADGFEAQAMFVVQRFFMSFEPRINDRAVQNAGRVAGGALDQYLAGRVALVWHMPN